MVSRKKILVVEDNVLNRSLLCQILAGQYDVLEAGDGQEALNILKQYGEKISLIMLDIIMPGHGWVYVFIHRESGPGIFFYTGDCDHSKRR